MNQSVVEIGYILMDETQEMILDGDINGGMNHLFMGLQHEFNQYRTDYTVTFGLMNNNRVEAFDCIDPSTNPTWGYMVCI